MKIGIVKPTCLTQHNYNLLLFLLLPLLFFAYVVVAVTFVAVCCIFFMIYTVAVCCGLPCNFIMYHNNNLMSPVKPATKLGLFVITQQKGRCCCKTKSQQRPGGETDGRWVCVKESGTRPLIKILRHLKIKGFLF